MEDYGGRTTHHMMKIKVIKTSNIFRHQFYLFLWNVSNFPVGSSLKRELGYTFYSRVPNFRNRFRVLPNYSDGSIGVNLRLT